MGIIAKSKGLVPNIEGVIITAHLLSVAFAYARQKGAAGPPAEINKVPGANFFIFIPAAFSQFSK